MLKEKVKELQEKIEVLKLKEQVKELQAKMDALTQLKRAAVR